MAAADDILDAPFPDPESLRPYIGKCVAYDEQGVVRLSAETWGELMRQLTPELQDQLRLLFVPSAPLIGASAMTCPAH